MQPNDRAAQIARLKRLAALMKDETAPAGDRVAAANQIILWAYGPAEETYEHIGNNGDDDDETE